MRAFQLSNPDHAFGSSPKIPLRARQVCVAIICGATVGYLLIFWLCFAIFAAGAAALAALPVALAGWLLGRRAGFVAGLLSIPLNTLLLNLAGIPGANAIIHAGGGPGTLMLVVMGVGVGWVSDLTDRLHAQARILTHEHEQLMTQIANGTQIEATLQRQNGYLNAFALENARLYTASQLELTERHRAEAALRANEQRYRELFVAAHRQAQELALLDHVRTALARELDLATVFRTVVEAIAATFGYTQVSLYLCQNEVLVLQHQVGYHQVIAHIPITHGVSGRVVRTGAPVLLEDVQTDSAFLGAIGGIVSEICVPLIDQDQIVGILNVESTQGVRLSAADLQLMLAVSTHVNIAIGRARLYAEACESEARYRSVIAALSEGIVVQGADGHILTCNASAERILGLSAEHLLGRTSFDPRWSALHEDESPFPGETHPAMVTLRTGVPQNNVVMGVYKPDGTLTWVATNTQPLFQPGSSKPYAVVASFADITERKQLEEMLRTQALRDPLTGLFNRRYLAEALERELSRAERTGTPVGVIMLDIDHFKRFNDTFGHEAGDVLLGEVGRFLQIQVRKEDLVCRYGGEEFLVILPGASLDGTQRRAEQVRERIKQVRVPYAGKALGPITLSLGVAVFPDHTKNRMELVRIADAALYRAKVSGRDQVVVGETHG